MVCVCVHGFFLGEWNGCVSMKWNEMNEWMTALYGSVMFNFVSSSSSSYGFGYMNMAIYQAPLNTSHFIFINYKKNKTKQREK